MRNLSDQQLQKLANLKRYADLLKSHKKTLATGSVGAGIAYALYCLICGGKHETHNH